MASSAGSAMTTGRIARALAVEALGDIPSLAVARALEAWLWSLTHGRDPQDSMQRARTAYRMAAPEHGRVLGVAHTDERNGRVLRLFLAQEWPTRAAMRSALELDVALGVEEAAEERRHAEELRVVCGCGVVIREGRLSPEGLASHGLCTACDSRQRSLLRRPAR